MNNNHFQICSSATVCAKEKIPFTKVLEFKPLNPKGGTKKNNGSLMETIVHLIQKKAKIKKVKTRNGTPPARIRSQCLPPSIISNANSLLTNPVPAVAPAIAIPQPIPSTNHNQLSTLSQIYDFPTLSSVPLHTLSNSISLPRPSTALNTLPLSDLDPFSLSNVVSDNPFSTLNTFPSNFTSDFLIGTTFISTESNIVFGNPLPLSEPILVDALSYIAAVYDQIFANLVPGSTPLSSRYGECYRATWLW